MRRPVQRLASCMCTRFKKDIDLQLGKLVVGEPKIVLIHFQAFSVYFTTVGSAVAVRAEGDEVVVLMFATFHPRHDMMNLDFDVATGGNGTSMASFDQHSSAKVRRYLPSLLFFCICHRHSPLCKGDTMDSTVLRVPRPVGAFSMLAIIELPGFPRSVVVVPGELVGKRRESVGKAGATGPRCSRLAHTARRTRTGPQDSSTNPQDSPPRRSASPARSSAPVVPGTEGVCHQGPIGFVVGEPARPVEHRQAPVEVTMHPHPGWTYPDFVDP